MRGHANDLGPPKYAQRGPAGETQGQHSRSLVQLRPIKSPGGNAFAFGNLYITPVSHLDHLIDFCTELLYLHMTSRHCGPAQIFTYGSTTIMSSPHAHSNHAPLERLA
jgi:hypothetical protein